MEIIIGATGLILFLLFALSLRKTPGRSAQSIKHQRPLKSQSIQRVLHDLSANKVIEITNKYFLLSEESYNL